MMGRIGAVKTHTYPEKRVNFSVNCHFFQNSPYFFHFMHEIASKLQSL